MVYNCQLKYFVLVDYTKVVKFVDLGSDCLVFTPTTCMTLTWHYRVPDIGSVSGFTFRKPDLSTTQSGSNP